MVHGPTSLSSPPPTPHSPPPPSSGYVSLPIVPTHTYSYLLQSHHADTPPPAPYLGLAALPHIVMSSISDFRYSGGAPDGPISPDAWKRAVYRRPPGSFHIKLLPPEKHGSSFSYGFRINAIKGDNASTITRATSSGDSIGSIDEYDIWRKWEDCLWFQDTLEVEYARAAREKRNRLAAGKGVKKNGVYIHSDQAASWESLPFGPDPSDIARDIHTHVPKLSKKGTLFRASQETVAQRYEDLQMMMQALLKDDLPTLIKEIKVTRTFTDFFGVWRRDLDLARKAESSKKSTADESSLSQSPNKRSTLPPSPSSFSIKSSSAKGKAHEKTPIPFRVSVHSDASSSDDCADRSRPSQLSNRREDIRSMRSRASSSESHSSSSSPSTPVSIPPQLPLGSRQPVILSQEVSARFGHNPHTPISPHVDRSPPTLESLPEDVELSSSPKSDINGGWARRRAGSTAGRVNRSARVYVQSPSDPSEYPDTSSRSSRRHSRASIQSRFSSATLGATSYLDELGVDYCLSSPPEPRSHPRASISSMASIMTNTSVDAVIPRNQRPARFPTNYASRPLSLPDESWRAIEPWSEGDSRSEDQGDILDSYFCDFIGPNSPTSSDFPETPTVEESMMMHQASVKSSYPRYSDRRSSFATSISSGSSSSSSGSHSLTLSIKAMHEENIVMLRLPRDVTFEELRQKIYDKFTQTDQATICKTFAVALMEPVGKQAASVKGGALHFISSQDEWEDIIAMQGGKLLLRIIGSRE